MVNPERESLLLHSTADEKQVFPNKSFFFIDSASTGYLVLKHREASSWSGKTTGFGIREMWLLI